MATVLSIKCSHQGNRYLRKKARLYRTTPLQCCALLPSATIFFFNHESLHAQVARYGTNRSGTAANPIRNGRKSDPRAIVKSTQGQRSIVKTQIQILENIIFGGPAPITAENKSHRVNVAVSHHHRSSTSCNSRPIGEGHSRPIGEGHSRPRSLRKCPIIMQASRKKLLLG